MGDFFPAYSANNTNQVPQMGLVERRARPRLPPPQPASGQTAADGQAHGKGTQASYYLAYQQQQAQNQAQHNARVYRMESQPSYTSRKAVSLYEDNEQHQDRERLVAHIQLDV